MSKRSIFQEEHEQFRRTVRRFVEAEILPHRVAWEKAGTVPPEVWRKAGEAGLLEVRRVVARDPSGKNVALPRRARKLQPLQLRNHLTDAVAPV